MSSYTTSEIMFIKDQKKKFHELLQKYPCIYESTNCWLYYLKGFTLPIMKESISELICCGTGKYKFTESWLTMDFDKVKEFLDNQVLRYKKHMQKSKKVEILKDFEQT